MNRVWIWLLGVALVLCGCAGGGGGGGTASVTGTVLWIPTNGAPNPAATVQIGSRAVLTNLVDGSFVQTAPVGTNSLLVSYTPPAGTPVTFTFHVPAVASNSDVGQLVIGPEKVTIRGRIISSETGLPVVGAHVTFGGQFGLSGSDGTFSLSEVGFSSSALANFLTLTGRVTATGFLPVTFGASSGPVSGVVQVGDLAMPPQSSDVPPTLPGNLSGRILPSGSAATTIVRVFDTGGTPLRQFTVGSSGQFAFWLPAGTYTLRATNGALTSGDVTVTITSVDTPIVRDLTLS